MTAVGAGFALAVAGVLAFLVARGERPQLGASSWLEADPVGVAVALLVATLGVTILSYAARNLEGDALSWRFSAAANGVLAATLLASVAGRLSVLVAAWVLTSLGVVALVAYRGDAVARTAARRAGLALGLGDLALLGAMVVVLGTVGDPQLSGLGVAATDLGSRQVSVLGLVTVDAAGAVALLLVAAAAARASQLPFPLWLPGTLAAPTPVSALLHAGVVNAGGFLLVRLSPVLAESILALVVLAVIAVVTILVAGGAALVRTDVKGALAASTSAQMGFMLLAVAVGAPLAAITHLIGHALYKAYRFLGAGEALTAARVGRGHQTGLSGPERWRVVLSVVVPAAVFTAVAWMVDPSVLHDGEAWVIGVAVGAIGIRATWAWLGRGPLGVRRVAGAAIGFAVALLVYLALLEVLGHLLGTSVTVDDGVWVDARWALGALLAGAGLVAIAARWRATSRWIVAPLSAAGRPLAPGGRRRPASRSVRPESGAPVLEGVR